MQPEKTVVIFRAGRTAPHDVTAVFPYEPAGPHGYEMSCYAHVGQHSACTYEWFLSTRPATPAEYADLKTELENYGPPDAHYRLVVRKRIAHSKRIEESRAQDRRAQAMSHSADL